jgi:hypothetical protein
LGDHLIRFGYDAENFESGNAGLSSFSGGVYYRLFRTGDRSQTVNGVIVAPNTDYVRLRTNRFASGRYDVDNTAAYVEDSWQVTSNLMLYLGLRSESFENFNGEGIVFAKAKNALAPRLGLAWDVNGDSTLKLYGNAGRYFIPLSSNTNVRASSARQSTEDFYIYDGRLDQRTSAPLYLGDRIGTSLVSGSLISPDPRTVSATNLAPMFQDEFFIGAQKQLSNHWFAGARVIHRDVKNGFDDFCARQPILTWAQDNGFANFNPTSLAQCVILNPGRDLRLGLDLENDGNLTEVTIPAGYLGLPDYQRKYYAMEFTFERAFADDWNLQGSYTWAHSYGNVEGYVNSTLEQDDAGGTQDFDNVLLALGGYGNLPNDRRHTVKIFGSYQFNEEWRAGTNFLAQSGRPINCIGYLPLNDAAYTSLIGLDRDYLATNYGASSFFCPDASGERVLGSRGDRGRTPWTFSFDLNVGYAPNWAGGQLELALDVFNIFNHQRVIEYQERAELGSAAAPLTSPNFLNDVNYQIPRSAQLTLRYRF